jgi:hypothetical protein
MELLGVGVFEEDEVYRRGVMAVLNEDGCVCIDLGGGREMSPEAADAEDSLDVVVVCSVESPSLSSEPTVMRSSGGRGAAARSSVHPAPSPFGRLSGGQAGGWDIRRGRG